jgi:hypothetical protein
MNRPLGLGASSALVQTGWYCRWLCLQDGGWRLFFEFHGLHHETKRLTLDRLTHWLGEFGRTAVPETMSPLEPCDSQTVG